MPSSAVEFKQGKLTFVGAVGETVRYMLDGNSHTVKIELIGKDEVKLLIKSVFIRSTLKIGQIKSYDIDGDQRNEISIKLVSISGSKATLLISLLGTSPSDTATDDVGQESPSKPADAPVDEAAEGYQPARATFDPSVPQNLAEHEIRDSAQAETAVAWFGLPRS